MSVLFLWKFLVCFKSVIYRFHFVNNFIYVFIKKIICIFVALSVSEMPFNYPYMASLKVRLMKVGSNIHKINKNGYGNKKKNILELESSCCYYGKDLLGRLFLAVLNFYYDILKYTLYLING